MTDHEQPAAGVALAIERIENAILSREVAARRQANQQTRSGISAAKALQSERSDATVVVRLLDLQAVMASRAPTDAGGAVSEAVASWLEPALIDLLATIARLEAERVKDGEALEFIAEGHDVGRHDGLPEDGPAHDADTMFAVARARLSSSARILT